MFFNDNPDIKFVCSPLRVCPIGSHYDYKGGKVTGMTLDASLDMVYSPRENGYINIQSMDFPDKEYFHLTHDLEYIPGFWGSYIRGAVQALQEDYVLKIGLNAMVSGKLPIGGLSSSAAVTTAYLMALCDVNGIEFTQYDIIRYSHWVETEFISLKNGILDQSANVLILNNQLIVMDCQKWEHEMIPKGKDFPEFEVVVYSGITKNLIGTDFNNRVDEVRVAGWMLQEMEGIALSRLEDVMLRDIPRGVYEKNKDQLLERFRKRATHSYTEQDRVEKGAEAWANGDIETFGQLMFESGHSSFYQQESGIPEMEILSIIF
ncbi:galactokinase [Aerococcus urinaeequi]|uniref:galactokinase n=1 Tax=Aerococcus urinaeequi TaxID=51665 RepID=UPI003AADFD89